VDWIILERVVVVLVAPETVAGDRSRSQPVDIDEIDVQRRALDEDEIVIDDRGEGNGLYLVIVRSLVIRGIGAAADDHAPLAGFASCVDAM
jgi:hypothetical protein